MPVITMILAACAALVNLWLTLRIGRIRTSASIMHGDGGNPLLSRRIRAQLNFAENAPIMLLLFLTLELCGANRPFLWVVAIVFVVARILHGIGMDSEKPGLPRMIGVGVTMLLTLAMIGYGIFLGYSLLTPAHAPSTIGATV